jgi:hypothetical protein
MHICIFDTFLPLNMSISGTIVSTMAKSHD